MPITNYLGKTIAFGKGKWDITLHWALVNDYPECVGIEILSPSMKSGPDNSYYPGMVVTTQAIRKIPIAALIEDSREKLVPGLPTMRRVFKSVKKRNESLKRDLLKDEKALFEEFFVKPKGKPGHPFEYGPEHYARVAAVYLNGGREPTKAVAEELVISRSAAAKQVARARQMGLLPPTTRGVPNKAKKLTTKKTRAAKPKKRGK